MMQRPGLIIVMFSMMVVAAITGCDKLNGISEVPEIGFESVAPTDVIEYADSLVFTISYRDGDGDLGQNNTDDNSLFVKDSRNEVTYGFRIPQLAPDGAEIAIEGNLDVILPDLAIIGGGISETATFTIWCMDRAGNESNKVESSAVTINAQ